MAAQPVDERRGDGMLKEEFGGGDPRQVRRRQPRRRSSGHGQRSGWAEQTLDRVGAAVPSRETRRACRDEAGWEQHECRSISSC